MMFILTLLILFFVGLVTMILFVRWHSRALIRDALREEQETLSDIEEQNESLLEETKKHLMDWEISFKDDWELQKQTHQEEINQFQSRITDKEEEFQRKIEEQNQQVSLIQSQVDRKQNEWNQEHQKHLNIKNEIQSHLDLYFKTLQEKVSSVDTVKKELITNLTQETLTQTKQWIIDAENEVEDHSEKLAKSYLLRALNRFNQPYCPDRSLGFFSFESSESLNEALGKDQNTAKIIETECGVDLVIREESLSLIISGFDPVRREWGRLCLDRVINDKHLHKEPLLRKIIQEEKRKLFKKIKSDGFKLAQKLKITNFHPEIQNMIGSLKYRYSYTQNQYSHVGEVGFLCGLLCAELGLSVEKGRRAGVLHDIGKAMDHSIDGGHAVIGADFIEKQGESDDIIHAVRAHHYDEQPNSELAYLVIAADAISGARPGARRSTAESYMQKMNQLEEIGSSFSEVQSTYVLSAGRELRVLVDSKRVSDTDAISLSRTLARTVEDKCNYPGSIKVTVVRTTQAITVAK